MTIYKRKLAKNIALLLDNNSKILDVGCDNGSVAKRIMEINPSLKIVGIDIQSRCLSMIPRKMYDGRKIPYPDKSFDIVMAIDVLHHTKDILSLLKEMKRVSKKYILIKDHMIYSFFSRCLISFTDYVANLRYGIRCIFNFLSFKEWDSYFKKAGLRIVEQPKNLKFGFWINERYNPIFKLERM
jgi:ubiquinone/menaquinone biosynthesis C-methylase UbiE